MLNILLIDDDPIEHMNLERLLKQYLPDDHSLNFAKSLEEGLDIMENSEVSVVFLDDNLGMGQAAKDNTRRLKRVSENLPIIVISNFVDSVHLASAAFMNVFDVIDKSDLEDRLQRNLLGPLASPEPVAKSI